MPEVDDVMEEPGEAPAEDDGVDFVHSEPVVEGFLGAEFECLVVGEPVLGDDFTVIADGQLVGNADKGAPRRGS